MGIFDAFRRQAPQVKASAAAQTLVLTPGQPAWTPRNYTALAREAYQLNVVAYQAVNKIAEAVASVPVNLFRGDVEVTESPLLDLIENPNPLQGRAEYLTALMGFYMLSGNAYQEKVRTTGEPRELYVLRSDRMKVIPSNTGAPAGFEYDMNGRKVRWDADPETLESDVWQIKTFNPVNDWYGMSPVEAAAYAVDQHNEAMKWMQSLLQNSARPSGALVSQNDSPLSDDQYNRLKSSLEEMYQGGDNAGRPMLLEGGLDWKEMGLSPVDMGIIEQKNSSARDICLAFGVPPQLLGIPGDNTYSNYAEARLAFWEDTVLPLLGCVYGAWNQWLVPDFGEKLELRPDLDQVPAIVEKRMALWAMADASQDLTLNERREIKGFEPVPGGDTLLVQANLLPLDMSLPMEESDIKALARAAGYPDNVTPLDRKAQ